MEAGCRRFCQGDTSSLPDIVNCIEAGQLAPTGKLGARAYTALATLLLREGLVLRKTCASGSALPSEEAFYALRILAILGSRHADEGHVVKSVLLSLGLQRCRDMLLDAYFSLEHWQRYYAIMFVTLLIGVYGCCPQDLLRNAASRNALIGSTDSGPVSPAPESSIESTELIPVRPHTTGRAAAATAGCSGGPAYPTSQANPQLHVVTRDSASPPRCASIPNRSAAQITIPGTSTGLPLQPARWYRELPRRPINCPYPVNPLYVSSPLLKDSGVTTDAEGRVNSGVLGDVLSPASPSLVPEILITAQFPAPVVLFSAYHGVGCVPHLPTTEDLTRLDAWRERKKRKRVPNSPAAASSVAPVAERPHEWGTILKTAQQMRALDIAATDDGQQPFVARNEMISASPSPEASAYRRRRLESYLLQQYMERGKLLSWGSLAKGALGQHSQRRGRSTLALPKKAATSSDLAGLNAQVGGAAPVATSATQQHSSAPGAAALGRNGWQTSLAGCDSPTAGQLMTVSKVPLAREPSATDGLPATRPGERSMVDQSRASPSEGLLSATLSASAGALAVSAAPLNGTSSAGYVYLPLSVCTPVRVAQVACGLAVTYVVTVDGVLYSCGRSDNGQLGIGERGSRFFAAGASKLQRVLLKDNERVTRVAAGTACAVALTADGALYCWGHNVYGQCLKMPDASRVPTPVRLRVGAKVLDVCFGQFFGVLLFDDGVMGTWGIASMLGCKMSDERLEPSLASDQCKCSRQIVHLRHAMPSPIVAVRAGPWHALAISQRGEVYTWGVGRNGRLGHGTDRSEVMPRLVEGLQSSFVVDASCSYGHSALLTSTGTVYVFGENTEGQLGLRGCAPWRLPTMVPLPAKAVAVSCAREHTCILLEDGDVVACGSYRTCGLGLGYGRRLCAPARILTNYVTLTLHSGHLQSMAGVVQRHTAVMVVGHSAIEEVSRVSSLMLRNGVRCTASGAGFIVVLSENNSLVAIGRGECGQLGIGDCMRPNRSDDVTVAADFCEVHIPSDVVIQHVRCGPDFVLALDESGVVYGWGSNDHQKLCQSADIAHVFSPVHIAAYASERIVQIVCGGTFVVALTADGEVLTHGEAMYCGLGATTSPTKARDSDVSVPTRVAGLHDIVAVAAGRRHAVVMTASCSIFAWGVGVLGTGSTTTAGSDTAFLTSITPAPVRVALSQTIRSIGCGPDNSFAITDEGELWVWGMNKFGECGMPTSGSRASTGGGTLQNLTAGQKRGSDGVADDACAIATPTCVARQVRDAAFTGQFGVVVFENGQVSVSGRIWHGGQRYLLPSFHSTPQPPFFIDVNEPVRYPSPEPPFSFSAALIGGDGGGGASAAAASVQRQRGRQGSADTNVASTDENEQSASSCAMLPTAGKPVMLHTDGQHQRRPQPPLSPWTHVARTGVPARPTAPAHGRKSPPHRAALSSPRIAGGRSSPLATSSHAATMVGAPAPLTTPNIQLPSFASPRLVSRDAMLLESGEDTKSGCSPPCLPGLTPSRQGCMHQATTAAAVGAIDAEGVCNVDEEAQTNLTLAETYLYGDEYSSPGIGAPLSNSEVPGEVVACTPMPPRRVSDGAATSLARVRTLAETQGRKPMSTTRDVLKALVPPLLTLSPDCSTMQCASAGIAPARAPVSRQTPSPQSTQREPKAWAGAVFQPPKASTPSPPLPPSVSAERIFGIRCFAGWERICIAMEKDRPSVTEVAMAQRGLQVLLHRSKNAVQEV